MCEHNLVIGNRYTLSGGYTTCACGYETPDKHREVIYLGDIEIQNYHNFLFLVPFYCGGCGGKVTKTNVACGSSVPIDVTKEFLSLPVRGRE